MWQMFLDYRDDVDALQKVVGILHDFAFLVGGMKDSPENWPIACNGIDM